ncbi:MAG: hypothetical protein OXN84_05350 [Albidovulum sp.]|nr:hypothetical protein [Albidovulum sp.]MDE0532633.1 hypothetical protein [Albidovulum sp.]
MPALTVEVVKQPYGRILTKYRGFKAQAVGTDDAEPAPEIPQRAESLGDAARRREIRVLNSIGKGRPPRVGDSLTLPE